MGGGQAVQQSANNAYALLLPGIPDLFPRPTEFKLTLPGTNYCGPGGGGNPTNRVDEQCAYHDKCEEDAGVGFLNNIFGYGKQDAIRACNAKLCSGIKSIKSPTSAEARQGGWVTGYFGCGG